MQVMHPMAQMGMAGYHPMYMPQPYFAPAGMSPPGMATLPVRPLLHSWQCCCTVHRVVLCVACRGCSSALHSGRQRQGRITWEPDRDRVCDGCLWACQLDCAS